MDLILLVLVLVCLSSCEAAAPSTSCHWSNKLSSLQQETKPFKPCKQIQSKSACEQRNMCCYRNSKCMPSNLEMVECAKQANCNLDHCFVDAQGRCRRLCASGVISPASAKLLCNAVGKSQQSRYPTKRPSAHPTAKPTRSPTARLTKRPTAHPSVRPTEITMKPTLPLGKDITTNLPTSRPTQSPTNTPGVYWSPELIHAEESSPALACAALRNEYACARQNYCCWRDNTCFPPIDIITGFECALVREEEMCTKAWGAMCLWRDSQCKRRLPAISKSMSAQQVCDSVFARQQHLASNATNRPLFDAVVTAKKNETLLGERSTALNTQNQYCWNKATSSPCQFPFTYQNIEYRDCVVVSGTSKCMLASGAMAACTCTAQQRKRSVLIITLDDFRPEMNMAYGRKSALTPVMDDLARRPGTVVFDRAYTQIAWCSPSRDSYLSGLLPDTTKSYTFAGTGLKGMPYRNKIKTLPELFKDAGYWTAGGGKIFHLGREDPKSWNVYYSNNVQQNSACLTDDKATRFKLFDGTRTRLACTTAKYENILDTQVMNTAITALERIVHEEREPFFLAVGLFKPHLPHHVYTPFWTRATQMPDYEDFTNMHAPGPQTQYRPELTYDLTNSETGSIWGLEPFQDKSNDRNAASLRALLRQGYQASVYQTDDMIGQILNKIETLGLRSSTLVVIHGDHGFHLGESNVFAKLTNFEVATRVPVVFHVPWFVENNNGKQDVEVRRNSQFFELLDLMPTIAGLMQVAKPERYEGLDQTTQIAKAALFRQANIGSVNVKQAAFSQVLRCTLDNCSFAALQEIYAMGYSVRTDKWRYTAFFPFVHGNNITNLVDWQTVLSQELYDHSNDAKTMLAYDDTQGAKFASMELENVASNYAAVCTQMLALIRQKYRDNRPVVLL